MGGLLTGQLAYVFLVAIVDAAVISWVALRWYRHAVRRLMRERGSAPDVEATVEAAGVELPASNSSASPVQLTMALFDTGAAAPRTPSWSAGWPRRKLVIAYGAGAALHAAVMTVLFFKFDISLPPPAWFIQWWVFTWPIVPTLAVVLALTRRDTILLAVGYLVIGAVGTAVVTLAGQALRGSVNAAPLTNTIQFFVSLAATAWLPLALVLLTGWRRIRAVTPLALSAMLIFGFALLLFRQAFIAALNVSSVQSVLLAIASLTSTQVMYYGLFMILVLPVGWLPWRLLQSLATRFEHKRFSDVQLIVDCWWLIITAEQIVTNLSTPYGLPGVAAGLAAFAAYRVTVALCLSWLPDAEPDGAVRKRLLLLRVFGFQARTETLFDRVAQQWRFHGPVQLIAGADLAMRVADPGDVLAFVGGRLAERYVSTIDDARRRVGELDTERDPDGRFRVSEVYCHEDNWRPALDALLGSSDIVLMDLRSFSRANSGCVYELDQLVSHLSPEQIVFVYDQTTDLRLLGSCLSDGWRHAARGESARTGSISCVRVERNSWPELQLLVRHLLGTQQPSRVIPIAELASA